MYSSWDIVNDRCNCYFSFWAIFCTFTPLTAQNIKILKKWKKSLEISSFYIGVPKIKIRWCTVNEIWCMTDVIIFHFGPFSSPNNPKDKIFEKLKKDPRDIIILHKCAKNHNHMLYCSLYMACNRFNYFSFCAIFNPFTSLTAWKIKIKKKLKKIPGDIIILHMYTKNYDQMMYSSWHKVCDGCNYFSFWAIFCSFTP